MSRIILNILFLIGIFEYSYSQVVVKPIQITSKIVYFTGNDMYISSGTEQSVLVGDTLYISINANQNVAYKVLSSSSNRSLIRPINDVVQATIGQEIAIYFSPNQIQKAVVDSTQFNRTSILTGAETVRNSSKKEKKFSGRYFTSLNSMFSATRWNEHIKDYVIRYFVEPQTGVSLSMSQLPNDWSVSVDTRLEYRYASTNSITSPTQVRIYQLQAQKQFTSIPLFVQLGRFYNYNDSFSGFWDGALVELRKNGFGLGVIAGTEPLRSSETISFTQPKYSAYSYYNAEWNGIQTQSELSATHITPDFGFAHDFLGFRESIRFNKTRFNFTTQLDKDPNGTTWKPSYTQAFVSQGFGNSFVLTARYARREPFRYWSIRPFGEVNEQIGIGFSWTGQSIRFGADTYINQLKGNTEAQSFSSFIDMNNLTKWNFGWNVSNQLWLGKSAYSIYASTSVTKQFSRLWFSSGYQFNYSNYYDSITHTHGLFTQLQANLKSLGSLSVRYSVDAGLLMIRSGLYVSLWRSF